MKKIVFFIDKDLHFKVFQPFTRLDNDSFHVLVPHGFKYKLNFKNVTSYKSAEHAKNIIGKIKPDVFVQSRSKGKLHDYLSKAGIKKVLLGHGILTNSEIIARLLKNHAHVYNRYDLMCLATEKYDKAPMLRNTNLKDKNIVATGLSQFDNLYCVLRDNGFEATESQYDKTILFAGGYMILSEKNKYVPRKEYYSYVKYLAEVCNKNNWKLLIKPRADDLSFLKQNVKNIPWTKQYVDMYANITKSENITLLDSDSNIYEYFNSDVVILDGWSTVEIETCLANVPTIVISKDDKDYIGTVVSGAIWQVGDINMVEEKIKKISAQSVSVFQKAVVNDMGIKFDGKCCERIINNINLL